MPLHPRARALLDAESAPPATTPSIADMRAESITITRELAGPGPELAQVRDRSVGGVPCRVYLPLPEAVLPTVIHVHGGGWVAGSLDTHDTVCRMIAAQSGWNVVAVDYRLAPEHPYPAATTASRRTCSRL